MGKQLKRILNNEVFINLETILTEKDFENLKTDFSKGNLTTVDIKILSDNLLSNIFKSYIQPVTTDNTDNRVLKSIEFINQNLIENLTLEKVANHIYLSPERTRHLFLEQVEIPFSQYILWKRIKAVLTSVIQGKLNLNEASLEYGFTDQSHFNRFFKRMFGISATIILKNSRFVQFIYPEL